MPTSLDVVNVIEVDKTMRTCWMVLALVVGLAAGGSAKPLDCAQVPAEAQWLVHVDLGAISRGIVSQKIIDR